jgi:hypothetical protein
LIKSLSNSSQNLFISRIAFDETFQSIIDQQKFEVKKIAYYMKIGHLPKDNAKYQMNTNCRYDTPDYAEN